METLQDGFAGDFLGGWDAFAEGFGVRAAG
jgi:hypothetical protein